MSKRKALSELEINIRHGHINRFKAGFAIAKANGWAEEFINGEGGRLGLLHEAAMSPSGTEIIEYLIDKERANVDAQDTKGRTPLFFACDRGIADNVIALLVKHANPRIPETHSGEQCIHVAAHGESEDVIKALLSAGVKVTETNEAGATPVHIAARYSLSALHALYKFQPKQVEALINTPDNAGDTPLHYAALDERGHCAKFLLFIGADSTILNNDGKTPYEVAEEWESEGKAGEAIIGFKTPALTSVEEFYTSLVEAHERELSGDGSSDTLE